jgi:hypothetical protein
MLPIKTLPAKPVLVPAEHTLKGNKSLKKLFGGLKSAAIESMTVTVSIDPTTSKAQITELLSVCGAKVEKPRRQAESAVLTVLFNANFREMAAEGIASALETVPSGITAIYAEVQINVPLQQIVARDVMFRFDGIDAVELT